LRKPGPVLLDENEGPRESRQTSSPATITSRKLMKPAYNPPVLGQVAPLLEIIREPKPSQAIQMIFQSLEFLLLPHPRSRRVLVRRLALQNLLLIPASLYFYGGRSPWFVLPFLADDNHRLVVARCD